jgi:MoxR-like ATPase
MSDLTAKSPDAAPQRPFASGAATHTSNGTAPTNSLAQRVRARVSETVVGQDDVVESILIALLTGGHLLLQGVPGLAKTLLVNAVSKAIDLSFGRVQFTIDLLPADIVGSEILDEAPTGTAGVGRQFRVHKGPIFTNLLLADEINRATPKVQSALLEAMQERRVTIGTHTIPLPTPFVVIATQNPVEQSGTFELPEAQLDRFMLCHRLNYPTKDQEIQVVQRSLSLGLKKGDMHDRGGAGAIPMSAFDAIRHEPVVRVSELTEAMQHVQSVHVSEVFVQHVVDLVERTRTCPDLDLGCSPRAGIALTHAARARAFIHGRSYATPEDLFSLAESVMMHRMRLTYEAMARGRTARDILRELMDRAV